MSDKQHTRRRHIAIAGEYSSGQHNRAMRSLPQMPRSVLTLAQPKLTAGGGIAGDSSRSSDVVMGLTERMPLRPHGDEGRSAQHLWRCCTLVRPAGRLARRAALSAVSRAQFFIRVLRVIFEAARLNASLEHKEQS